MYKSATAEVAYNFLQQFKQELLRQIWELNARNDGELQDGFNPVFIDDGWVSLKGFAWGFVVHYDAPVRMDMTFGPDWPFVGHRTTFLALPAQNALSWVNETRPLEVYRNAYELSRFGLRRLAAKVGDEHIFLQPPQAVTIDHDPYYGNELTLS